MTPLAAQTDQAFGREWLDAHMADAYYLGKPVVIEEFGKAIGARAPCLPTMCSCMEATKLLCTAGVHAGKCSCTQALLQPVGVHAVTRRQQAQSSSRADRPVRSVHAGMQGGWMAAATETYANQYGYFKLAYDYGWGSLNAQNSYGYKGIMFWRWDSSGTAGSGFDDAATIGAC